MNCRCGHDRAAHEHYRAGTDCALCGCPRRRRVFWLLAGFLNWLCGEQPDIAEWRLP